MLHIIITVALLIVGLVLIVKGGDVFVDAASWIAEVSGIPKLIVGATIVSLATTLPEMLVSVIAAAKKSTEISVGNAVGSVTANTGLIMAIAFICMPSVIKRSEYMVKSILMLVAAAIIVICGYFHEVSVITSIGLLVIFAIAMYENVHNAKLAMKNQNEGERRIISGKKEVVINIVKFLLGAAAIAIGANLLVDNGKELAVGVLHVSERIVAITIIAIGTSLPELTTTLTAISKKQFSLSAGNIIGANIMDLTLIMPISAVVSGSKLPISANSAILDLPACLIIGLVALVPSLITKKFSRLQGVLLLALYVGYVVISCII